MLNDNRKSDVIREQMLAIVSHDIKNPLSIIQLEAQMILKIVDSNKGENIEDKIKLQASRILKTSERIKHLISDLLDRHRVEDGLSTIHKAYHRLSDIIREVVDNNIPLLKERSLIISFESQFEEELLIDNHKITQVLSNLLSNAIKFSPHGGEIKLFLIKNIDEILFSINDQGPGIKEQELAYVFEKYWSGGVQGCSETGLGLFICKTIIEAHGGQIHVDNIVGEGASFSFSIPISLGGEEKNWIKDKKRKILVIDDDEDLRDVICWALEKEGYPVHGYGNAQEALVGLEQGRHSPVLMIVDFYMDEVDGFEFIEAKKHIDIEDIADCPVILISSSIEDFDSEIEASDLKEVVAKPLDLDKLVSKVSQLVSK